MTTSPTAPAIWTKGGLSQPLRLGWELLAGGAAAGGTEGVGAAPGAETEAEAEAGAETEGAPADDAGLAAGVSVRVNCDSPDTGCPSALTRR